jgi:hypothetical protein
MVRALSNPNLNYPCQVRALCMVGRETADVDRDAFGLYDYPRASYF